MSIKVNGSDLDEFVGMHLIRDEDDSSDSDMNDFDSDLASGLSFDELDQEEKKKVRKEIRKFKKGFSN